MVTLLQKVNLSPKLPTRGPYPVVDAFGAKAAIAMILICDYMEAVCWIFQYVHVVGCRSFQSANYGG